MIQAGRVIALALIPATLAMAGIDFGSTENGSMRPAWGRPQAESWGLSQMLTERVNKLTGTVPYSDPSAPYDPIRGFGADNFQYLGYQIAGPKGTRLIFDRLVAQQVIHVLGGDTDDQIVPSPDDFETPKPLQYIIGGDLYIDGGDLLQARTLPPTPVPVPEPASAALFGVAAAFALACRRPRRQHG